jgi:hypothetical protein
VNLAYCLRRIVEIDNELSGLAKSEVVSICDGARYRALKSERRSMVAGIQAEGKRWRDQQ